MYTEPRPQKSFRDYEEIARLERSRAFHAGVAWIGRLIIGRKTTEPRGVANAC